MKKRLSFLAAAAMLWCCITVGANEVVASARRVAVAVWVGHELNLQRSGALVFGNERGKVAVVGDELASMVYEAVSRELAQERRFSIRRVTLEPHELRGLGSKAAEGSTGVWRRSIDHMSAELTQALARCECDVMLVVAEGASERVTRAETTIVEAEWAGPAEAVTSLDVRAWRVLGDGLFASTSKGLLSALFELGLRPSCTLFFHLVHTSPQQREPGHARYVPPPEMPEGANADWCTSPNVIR